MDITKEKILCTAIFDVGGQKYTGVYGTLAELKAAIKQHVEDMNNLNGDDRVEFPAGYWREFVGEAYQNWQNKSVSTDNPVYLDYVFEDGTTVFAQTTTKLLAQELFSQKNKALTAADDAITVLWDYLEAKGLGDEILKHPFLKAEGERIWQFVGATIDKIRLASGRVKK